jgi:hypothetical protein
MLERRKFKAVHSENPEREVNSLLKTTAHIRASVGASAKSCDILRASLPATYRGGSPPRQRPYGGAASRAEPPCEEAI